MSDPVRWWATGFRGWEELGPSVVAEPYLPGGVVDGAVVLSAEQHEVVQGGRAAVEPVADVVGVAHHRRSGAAGEGAVAVAGHERGPDRGGDQPVGAADVEHTALGIEQDPDQVGIA